MKKLTLLAIILSAFTANAAISQKTVSAYDEAKRTQLIEWAEQLREKMDSADKQALDAEQALAMSEDQRKTAEVNLGNLQTQITALAADRDKLANDVVVLKAQVLSEKARADKEHMIASKNARERDIFIVILAIVGTIVVLQLLSPLINTAPPPYNILAWIGACIGSFFGWYALIRIVLALIVGKL